MQCSGPTRTHQTRINTMDELYLAVVSSTLRKSGSQTKLGKNGESFPLMINLLVGVLLSFLFSGIVFKS